MAFFNSAVTVLQTLVIALGARVVKSLGSLFAFSFKRFDEWKISKALSQQMVDF